MTTATLFPTKNTYVSQPEPSTEFSSDTKLIVAVDGRTGSGSYFSWMGFDISSIPSTATINSAMLYVNNFFGNNNTSYSDYAFNIHRSTDTSWAETINYNTEPSFIGTIVDSSFFGSGIGIHTFNVTSAVSAALSSGFLTLTMRPDSPSSWSDFIAFWFSREPYSNTHPPEHPKLIIDYTPASTFKPQTMVFM